MSFELYVIRGIALTIAALVAAGAAVWLLLRWHWQATLARARRIAARLNRPAQTLAEVEDQAAAVEELIGFPETRAAVAVARELLGARDAAVRSAAAEILRGMRALDLWMRDLRRGGYRAKLRAIRALGEVGDERAVEELLEALGDDDPDVARAASYAIVLRDPDYACERLAEALASPNRRLAETAAATLVRMGKQVVEPLMGQLESSSVLARRLAAESLGSVGEADVFEALLTRLEGEPDPEVRTAMAEALARIDGEAAAPELRRLARGDPDWFVRARAYALLAETNAPGATGFLLEALRDCAPDPEQFSDEGDAVESVLEGAERVRSAIIVGLRLLGMTEEQIAGAVGQARAAALPAEDMEEVSGLLLALRDRDPVRRAEAARRLGGNGEVAVKPLKQALQDPHPLVRAEAARALGLTEARDSLEALAGSLHDPDANVRLAAAAAIREIVTREAARELEE